VIIVIMFESGVWEEVLSFHVLLCIHLICKKYCDGLHSFLRSLHHLFAVRNEMHEDRRIDARRISGEALSAV